VTRSLTTPDTLGAPNPVIHIAHTHTIPRTIDTPTGDLSGGNLQKVVIAREDLDEVMELSGRFIVLLEGEMMGEVARADFDAHTIGLLSLADEQRATTKSLRRRGEVSSGFRQVR
jgi:ABC-type sugar transport system ATPase subunit